MRKNSTPDPESSPYGEPRRRDTLTSTITWLTAVAGLAALAIAGLTLGAWMYHRGGRTGSPPTLTITFPELPDGDCGIIRTPDGHIVLIDAGGPNSWPELRRTLAHVGVKKIDLLVLGSPDASGLGGVRPLLRSGIPVLSVWNTALPATDRARRHALDEIAKEHVPVRIAAAGLTSVLGTSGARLTVVWPPERSPRAAVDGVLCRLDFGQSSMLLGGPLDAPTEDYVVSAAGADLPCDVLQVVDHGADGTSLEMLRRTAPEIAVICSEQTNPPSPGVLHRLQAAGAEIWRTDQQGTITIHADGRGAPVVVGSRQ